ncbi:hypothetical protein B0H14DRAFT_3491337 [Mycena olivaceomarginata]|nr:hypothetical protein B0H14DRAFT_3491337 [Mycena olivaceomarginata]
MSQNNGVESEVTAAPAAPAVQQPPKLLSNSTSQSTVNKIIQLLDSLLTDGASPQQHLPFSTAQTQTAVPVGPGSDPINAILNSAVALQSTAEDFLESLDQCPGLALAELINLVLRACGCNKSLDADQVVDYDGVLDALDEFTEGLKKEQVPTTYPLTSKLPVFKKFRNSLNEFFDRLITSAASSWRWMREKWTRTRTRRKENDSGDEGSDAGEDGKRKGEGKGKAAPKTKKCSIKEGSLFCLSCWAPNADFEPLTLPHSFSTSLCSLSSSSRSSVPSVLVSSRQAYFDSPLALRALWRAPEITDDMDKHTRVLSEQHNEHGPSKAMRSMLQKVGRGGLPKCMYSSEWLGTLGALAYQDLEASEEEFRPVRYIVDFRPHLLQDCFKRHVQDGGAGVTAGFSLRTTAA